MSPHLYRLHVKSLRWGPTGRFREWAFWSIPGRRSDDEITLYKSLGIAVEDLASGRYTYRKALASGRGTVLDLK